MSRPFWWPTSREWVVGAIFVLFAIAYVTAWRAHDRESLIAFNGAILTAFAAAWGYFLGSSKGAAENRDALNSILAKPDEPKP